VLSKKKDVCTRTFASSLWPALSTLCFCNRLKRKISQNS
jgi:hypothetical protein